GGPIVDNYGRNRRFPAASMVTGLLGNALGLAHEDALILNELQERLYFGSVIDRPGFLIEDYQTVDFSQDFLNATGWTTHGYREDRESSVAKATHIRYRPYYADCCCTVLFTLQLPEKTPTLAEVEHFLDHPVRPLFIGRKSCVPSCIMKRKVLQANSLLAAIKHLYIGGKLLVQLPAEEAANLDEEHLFSLFDCRDWLNQIHSGERLVWEGEIDLG
ncbi:MAG TPA: type I-E CRISPR-associated protein Cas5/CasD, partial [bacterium]|nr:type I-E CRISPR-associated protein Cas5/CasD [bacterium]